MHVDQLIRTQTGAGAQATIERSPMPMIEVAHLHKAYGTTVAVQDVSLTVHAGEIFGILGRNGAGKTTTVEYPGDGVEDHKDNHASNRGWRANQQSPIDTARTI